MNALAISNFIVSSNWPNVGADRHGIKNSLICGSSPNEWSRRRQQWVLMTAMTGWNKDAVDVPPKISCGFVASRHQRRPKIALAALAVKLCAGIPALYSSTNLAPKKAVQSALANGWRMLTQDIWFLWESVWVMRRIPIQIFTMANNDKLVFVGRVFCGCEWKVSPMMCHDRRWVVIWEHLSLAWENGSFSFCNLVSFLLREKQFYVLILNHHQIVHSYDNLIVYQTL